jgi:hypothetical protein
MAMITAIGLFVLSLLTAVLTKIAAEEVEAWSPFIIRRLIKLAVSWLPENKRERFDEEWRSHVNEVPGRVGKVLSAAGFLLAAHNMALTFRREHLYEGWLHKVTYFENVVSKIMMVANEIEQDKILASVASGPSFVEIREFKEALDKLRALVVTLCEVDMTTPLTPVQRLQCWRLRRVVEEKFDTASRQIKEESELCDQTIEKLDEWKRRTNAGNKK